ncbi:MAG TPA: MFS transporter [Candidatus Limnocylindrales bacterium]|nr:MFS transporter [Candidatus Limnocylindrales bacterium]
MAARTARFGLTPEVLRAALQDPDLRRLQTGWMAVNAGQWAYLVTNLVVAYDAGGAAATGLLGVASFVAPTVVSPFAGIPAARWRPERVLATVTALRVLAVALTVGLIAFDGPFLLLVPLVLVESGVGAIGRSLQIGLQPLLARSPAELVAANVAAGTAEGLGTFAGPAVSALLLAIAGPLGAYLGVLAIYALAVASIAGMHVPPTRPGRAPSVRKELIAGVRAGLMNRGPALILTGFWIQTGVRGALIVLTVVAAIELLGMGDSGAGALNAAFGAGGVVGAIGAVALAGRARLAPWFSVALVGWGAPIVVLGLAASPALAIALMLVVGASNAVLDVAGFTLLQRTTPNAVRVAVMGLLVSVAGASMAVGGFLAPILVDRIGIEGALIATGLVLPVLAVVTWPGVRNADQAAVVDTTRVMRIRADPLFAPLSMAIIEQLSEQLVSSQFIAGDELIHEGDAGDRYYLIQRGRVLVTQGGQPVREQGPGDSFGEIALLRDVPRTASVRALEPVETLTLSRDDFLDTMCGQTASRRIADAIVMERVLTRPAGGA